MLKAQFFFPCNISLNSLYALYTREVSNTQQHLARPNFVFMCEQVILAAARILKNPSLRLGTAKAADITKCAHSQLRGACMRLKLNRTYGHELINCEMSVYFDNVCRGVCAFSKHEFFDQS